MKIEYIIFDYGGTIDTNGIHWGNLIWHFFQKNNVEITEQEFKDAYVYTERILGNHHIIGPRDTFKRTLNVKIMMQLNWLNDHGYIDCQPQQLKHLRTKIVSGLYDYAYKTTTSNANILNILKSCGYHLGLVSNFYGNINTVLKEMGLTDRFDTVVESATVDIRKPNPEIYALAAGNMGVSDASTVLVVGDSFAKDITPAMFLGFKTAWIRNQQNNIAKSLFDKKFEARELSMPTVTIGKLSQIIEFLETGTDKSGQTA